MFDKLMSNLEALLLVNVLLHAVKNKDNSK